MRYTVVDVETPNRKNNSICSIALTYVVNDQIVGHYNTLVNPRAHFDDINVGIHGITPNMVRAFPSFDSVWEKIKFDFTDNSTVVAHNAAFDLCVIKKALSTYEIEMPKIDCICTLQVAKSLKLPIKNNKLDTLSEYFGIELLKHHSAECDSLACANLIINLCNNGICINDFKDSYKNESEMKEYKNAKLRFSEETQSLQLLQGILLGIISDNQLNEYEVHSLASWLNLNKHLSGNYPFDRVSTVVEQALADGVLEQNELDKLLVLFKEFTNPLGSYNKQCSDIDIHNKVICLTGDFETDTRDNLEQKLASQGAVCKSTVVKNTDFVLVGSLGSPSWKFGTFGSKVQKAKEINEKGGKIKIIKEKDFMKLIGEQV